MSYGPLMIDIAGTALSATDRQRLCHPLVGGIILFSRNYESRVQIESLCSEIHALRDPPLLIAVDHEGGRVQRFRQGFTALPPMRRLGDAWDQAPGEALESARTIGYLMAAELRALGVDLSFAPVLDLDWQRSGVIGDRALHSDPDAVVALAGALIDGIHEAGMSCCGKHFPGHGWTEADSHVAIPTDERGLIELEADLTPYRRLQLDAIMPAHVIYPQVDSRPAGFSPVWMDMLRNEFEFAGVIFSDDLSMEGAAVAGDIIARAEAATRAGCDMLPVCNAPDAVANLLEHWAPPPAPASSARIALLLPRTAALPWNDLAYQSSYLAGQAAIGRLATLPGRTGVA